MIKQLIDYKIYCQIPFGAYTQTHEDNAPLNDTEAPRTLSAISLGLTGNKQGRYFFLNMTTLKVVKGYHFTELPVPREIIRAVENTARDRE